MKVNSTRVIFSTLIGKVHNILTKNYKYKDKSIIFLTTQWLNLIYITVAYLLSRISRIYCKIYLNPIDRYFSVPFNLLSPSPLQLPVCSNHLPAYPADWDCRRRRPSRSPRIDLTFKVSPPTSPLPLLGLSLCVCRRLVKCLKSKLTGIILPHSMSHVLILHWCFERSAPNRFFWGAFLLHFDLFILSFKQHGCSISSLTMLSVWSYAGNQLLLRVCILDSLMKERSTCTRERKEDVRLW